MVSILIIVVAAVTLIARVLWARDIANDVVDSMGRDPLPESSSADGDEADQSWPELVREYEQESDEQSRSERERA